MRTGAEPDWLRNSLLKGYFWELPQTFFPFLDVLWENFLFLAFAASRFTSDRRRTHDGHFDTCPTLLTFQA
jgi:hypothetical protein